MKLLGASIALVGLALAKQAYDSRLVAQGDSAGSARVQALWTEAEAKIKADAEAAAALDTARARAETKALQSKFDQLAASQQKDRIDYEKDQRIAVASALAGDERLSIAIVAADSSRAVSEVGAAEGAGVGVIPSAETRTYLMPETSAVILDIAGDYGQLVRDYNSLLERFGIMRDSCNAD